ncbi:AlpA family phage regulatory protein [Salmonella enterica]|nr:AlpA family phage regulatory protein [Salmonella enterica]
MTDILFKLDILQKFGFTEPSLYRYMKEGMFPKPDRREGKMVIWNAKGIEAWHKDHEYKVGAELRDLCLDKRGRPGRYEDLSGIRFNYWKVIRFAFTARGQTYFLCRCRCGRHRCVLSGSLKSGHSKSCGCRPAKKSNRMVWSRHPMYGGWKQMRQRCCNTRHISFKHYGGRGISVCLRWSQSFRAFLRDMGERPPGCTLERVNNDGNYSPENCVWADRSTQNYNRRNLRALRKMQQQKYLNASEQS